MIFKNTLKTFNFLILFLALFVVLRGIFILYVGFYHHEIGQDYSLSDIFYSLLYGARYDNRNIAIFTLIYFLSSFILKTRGLYLLTLTLSTLSIFIALGHMVFYTIYHDTFNLNLLGLFRESPATLLATGLSGDYNLMANLLAWLALSFIFITCYKKLDTKIDALIFQTPRLRALALPFLALSLAWIYTSSFKLKDSLIPPPLHNSNIFLHKIITDEYRALYFVHKAYRVTRTIPMGAEDITATAQGYFNLSTPPPYDLYTLLSQTSHNPSDAKITHIFYIISESLSLWNFEPRLDAIDLMSETKGIIKENGALFFDKFLESADATGKSLESQLTGLFNFDIAPLYGSLPIFETAISSMMKRLGYQTNFYFGGPNSFWKTISFAKSQGFDSAFQQSDMESLAHKKTYPAPYKNEWGVNDEILFDFIGQNTTSKPSFNMILTTSNHAPFDVPLESYGVPMDKLKAFIKDHDFTIDPKKLGHIYWYDKMLARFIRDMAAKYPRSLFIITGDHYGRDYLTTNPDISITKQVPLIIYSPTLKPHKTASIGSHLDIAPTIIELIAPKGFKYSSFGQPLASNDKTLKFPHKLALGYYTIGTANALYSPEQSPIVFKDSSDDLKALYKRLEQARALSWHLIFKGSIIP